MVITSLSAVFNWDWQHRREWLSSENAVLLHFQRTLILQGATSRRQHLLCILGMSPCSVVSCYRWNGEKTVQCHSIVCNWIFLWAVGLKGLIRQADLSVSQELKFIIAYQDFFWQVLTNIYIIHAVRTFAHSNFQIIRWQSSYKEQVESTFNEDLKLWKLLYRSLI